MEAHNEDNVLRYLLEHGPSTAKTLEQEALGDVDQIDEAAVAAGCKHLVELGQVEPVEGSSTVRRWQITDAGRRRIGDDPGR
jgi:DNA-binding MarR family transcriptional regulator